MQLVEGQSFYCSKLDSYIMSNKTNWTKFLLYDSSNLSVWPWWMWSCIHQALFLLTPPLVNNTLWLLLWTLQTRSTRSQTMCLRTPWTFHLSQQYKPSNWMSQSLWRNWIQLLPLWKDKSPWAGQDTSRASSEDLELGWTFVIQFYSILTWHWLLPQKPKGSTH